MGFKPDYGLRLVAEGILSTDELYFKSFHAFSVTILGDASYTTVVDATYEGALHALSLDFNRHQLDQILAKAGLWVTAPFWADFHRDPVSARSIDLKQGVVFGVRARLGQLQKAEKEAFVPLIAHEIFQ
ncbi:hypothetical protein SAMN03159423_5154 [Bradyrhizobium sp. NFR13]|uniref:hypothetical protein n=1 Tax=Bradyrhizobium sp. NFR13 TaxID=1566285 RepID=UPI0008DFFBA2|nr:hypothetical protein [Bradyrhizobium sp. NFR13]SFM06024.1 hypothetical protein SAMN03159423_5154 [Bradyrhizobium sp. NFR13]